MFDNVFALGWMMAARLDPQIPARLRAYATADRRRLEQLADRLWQELHARAGKDAGLGRAAPLLS